MSRPLPLLLLGVVALVLLTACGGRESSDPNAGSQPDDRPTVSALSTSVAIADARNSATAFERGKRSAADEALDAAIAANKSAPTERADEVPASDGMAEDRPDWCDDGCRPAPTGGCSGMSIGVEVQGSGTRYYPPSASALDRGGADYCVPSMGELPADAVNGADPTDRCGISPRSCIGGDGGSCGWNDEDCVPADDADRSVCNDYLGGCQPAEDGLGDCTNTTCMNPGYDPDEPFAGGDSAVEPAADCAPLECARADYGGADYVGADYGGTDSDESWGPTGGGLDGADDYQLPGNLGDDCDDPWGC